MKTFRIKPRSIKIHRRNKRTGHFQSKRKIMLAALRHPWGEYGSTAP